MSAFNKILAIVSPFQPSKLRVMAIDELEHPDYSGYRTIRVGNPSDTSGYQETAIAQFVWADQAGMYWLVYRQDQDDWIVAFTGGHVRPWEDKGKKLYSTDARLVDPSSIPPAVAKAIKEETKRMLQELAAA